MLTIRPINDKTATSAKLKDSQGARVSSPKPVKSEMSLERSSSLANFEVLSEGLTTIAEIIARENAQNNIQSSITYPKLYHECKHVQTSSLKKIAYPEVGSDGEAPASAIGSVSVSDLGCAQRDLEIITHALSVNASVNECNDALALVIKLKMEPMLCADLVAKLVAKGGQVKEQKFSGHQAKSYYEIQNGSGVYWRIGMTPSMYHSLGYGMYDFLPWSRVSKSPILLALVHNNSTALTALLNAYPGGPSKAMQEVYCFPASGHWNDGPLQFPPLWGRDPALFSGGNRPKSALHIACRFLYMSRGPNSVIRTLADRGFSIEPPIEPRKLRELNGRVKVNFLEAGYEFDFREAKFDAVAGLQDARERGHTYAAKAILRACG